MKFIKKMLVSITLASVVSVGIGALSSNTQEVHASVKTYYFGAGSSAEHTKKLNDYSYQG